MLRLLVLPLLIMASLPNDAAAQWSNPDGTTAYGPTTRGVQLGFSCASGSMKTVFWFSDVPDIEGGEEHDGYSIHTLQLIVGKRHRRNVEFRHAAGASVLYGVKDTTYSNLRGLRLFSTFELQLPGGGERYMFALEGSREPIKLLMQTCSG